MELLKTSVLFGLLSLVVMVSSASVPVASGDTDAEGKALGLSKKTAFYGGGHGGGYGGNYGPSYPYNPYPTYPTYPTYPGGNYGGGGVNPGYGYSGFQPGYGYNNGIGYGNSYGYNGYGGYNPYGYGLVGTGTYGIGYGVGGVVG